MDPPPSDETPKKQLLSMTTTTPKNRLARFLLLASNQSFTPSPLRHRIVRNPFEHHLHETLHLPVISSPSLFHMSTTPNRSDLSRHEEAFEWTIEDLSELHPVNVVPHETQFLEELDPIREAEAQAAINSFFLGSQKIGKRRVLLNW